MPMLIAAAVLWIALHLGLAGTSLRGLVVLDEVQRQPGLFPLLRVLMDRSDAPGQYLLLGSASPSLARQAGKSLLGRVETIEVGGFDLQEVTLAAGGWSAETADRLWLRGGFPRSWLAATDEDSLAWRHAAIAQPPALSSWDPGELGRRRCAWCEERQQHLWDAWTCIPLCGGGAFYTTA